MCNSFQQSASTFSLIQLFYYFSLADYAWLMS